MPRKAVVRSDELPAAPPELNEAGFDSGDIQVVSEDRMKVKADEAKFFEQKVLIEIEPGTKENDPVYVHLGHNGITQMVKRGEPQAVKRKFLYAGLMAKQVTFACDFRRAGDKEINRLTPTVSGAYRISLIRDDNPQGGMPWVQRVMRESTGVRA